MTAALVVLKALWGSIWFRRAAALVGVAALGLALHRRGWSQGQAEAHAEDAAREQAALAAADSRYRAQEVANEKRVSDLRVEYANRQAAARALDAQAMADLSSGARRVRIPVARCGTDPASPGPAAGGADAPATAELPGPIAATLYAIAADGDAAIRQLTALQVWSRSAVALCNGAPAAH